MAVVHDKYGEVCTVRYHETVCSETGMVHMHTNQTEYVPQYFKYAYAKVLLVSGGAICTSNLIKHPPTPHLPKSYQIISSQSGSISAQPKPQEGLMLVRD